MAIILSKRIKLQQFLNCRDFKSAVKRFVLGIETSCDETAAAIVDERGQICGEAMASQLNVHLDFGGVIPQVASYLHRENIAPVVDAALKNSKLKFEDITAFATTVKPGLKSSLRVGLEYGKNLAKRYGKPFIPIHHMEAHTLTARMIEAIEFPFLVLLASGGHCQIAVVNTISEFLLLGTSQHNTPGEVLDKIARRLKLPNLPECSHMSGGRAIEHMASNGNPFSFKVPHSLTRYRDCNFSFSGYSAYALATIEEEEQRHDVAADGILPTVSDFCASLQHAFMIHLMHRIERAIIFCEKTALIPADKKCLVFSGGVACNQYIRRGLQELCQAYGYRFVSPPPKLCTDNGVMIAWNGMEKLKEGIDVLSDFDDIQPEPNAPLGIDYIGAVRKASIKVKVPQLDLQQESPKIKCKNGIS